jgi:solute carrier family 25 citrate transporter 1
MQAIASILEDGGIRAFWRGTAMRLGRNVISGGTQALLQATRYRTDISAGVLFTTAEAIAQILNPIFARESAIVAVYP